MLTAEQSALLLTIPASKKVEAVPFDPLMAQTAESILKTVHKARPELRTSFHGAAALGLPGSGGIDILILADPAEFDYQLPFLRPLFGEPMQRSAQRVQWQYSRGGYKVEVVLTDPSLPEVQEQLRVFRLLKEEKSLRKEYEQLKATAQGESYREYQQAKFEFFNRLLNDLPNS